MLFCLFRGECCGFGGCFFGVLGFVVGFWFSLTFFITCLHFFSCESEDLGVRNLGKGVLGKIRWQRC